MTGNTKRDGTAARYFTTERVAPTRNEGSMSAGDKHQSDPVLGPVSDA
jgi:hypothetical protein